MLNLQLSFSYQDILFHTARIFSSVFEIVLAYVLTNSFFTWRFRKKQLDFLPYVVLAGAMIFLQEREILTGAWKYVAVCAVLFGILFAFYTEKVRKKLVGSMIFALLIAVSEIAASLVYSMVLRRLQISGQESYMLLARSGLSNFIMILVALLIGALSRQYRRSETSLLLWIVLLSVPAITLITFSVYRYYIESYPENGRIFLYINLSCVGLIFINILVFVLFGRLLHQMELRREKDMLASQLSQQTASIGRMEALYNRTRTFRHDIKNHLTVMSMLAEQGNYDELKNYLQEMRGVIDESDYVRISGISAVDAILNEKMYAAQAQSITTAFDVVNLDKNDVAPLDLCIILSNALDNAIEANMRIEDKSARWIRLKVHGNETFSVISVSNPLSEMPKKRPDGTFGTGKADKESHGFGLKSIESTASKYNGEMLAKAEDGVFTLVVRLNSLTN